MRSARKAAEQCRSQGGKLKLNSPSPRRIGKGKYVDTTPSLDAKLSYEVWGLKCMPHPQQQNNVWSQIYMYLPIIKDVCTPKEVSILTNKKNTCITVQAIVDDLNRLSECEEMKKNFFNSVPNALIHLISQFLVVNVQILIRIDAQNYNPSFFAPHSYPFSLQPPSMHFQVKKVEIFRIYFDGYCLNKGKRKKVYVTCFSLASWSFSVDS